MGPKRGYPGGLHSGPPKTAQTEHRCMICRSWPLTALAPSRMFSVMKTKSVIITDPAKIREICLNQPKVSQEEMEASILAQLGKLPPSNLSATQSTSRMLSPMKASRYFPPPPPIASSASSKPQLTRDQAEAQVKAGQRQMREFLRGRPEKEPGNEPPTNP